MDLVSAWLVSGYARVFILRSVVIATSLVKVVGQT